ncbi:MAG TPA: MFS transporter [Prosthecobacter sp.]
MNPPQACSPPWQPAASAWTRARVSASVLFLADGAGFGTWAALIPTIRQKLDLSEAWLSGVLLAIVAGALVSMSLVGPLLARRGSRAPLVWLAPGYAVALALLGLAPGKFWLLPTAVLFGALKGALDVSINAQAITVERAGTRPIMASFQALWSLGGLAAALIVGAALKLGVLPAAITLGMAALLLVASLVSTGGLAGGDASSATPVKKKQGFRLLGGNMARIGFLAFIALFAEGVMMDWSAVYARSVAGAEEWLAPLAYGAFALMMAAGRWMGDGFTARFGGAQTLRAGGGLTLAGLLVVVLCPWWPVTFAGLALAGLGLANMVPVLFGAAGRAHEESVGQGVATVSLIGYFGFLLGPPAIGLLSHFSSLQTAFAAVTLVVLPLVLWGGQILRKARRG